MNISASRVAPVATGFRVFGSGTSMPSLGSAPTNRTRINRYVDNGIGTGTFGICTPSAGWLAFTHVPATDHAVRVAAKQAAPPRGVPR